MSRSRLPGLASHTGRAAVWALVAVMPWVVGCTRDVVLEESDAGLLDAAGIDSGLPGFDAGTVEPKCLRTAPVDLLFVVDNSNSMTEEQASLADSMPGLIELLTDPPDSDGDGEPDWLPVESLHLGVVTTDMGVGGFNVPTCNDDPNFGDDGVLWRTGNVSIPGCGATYPPFLQFRPGDDPVVLAQDFACVARMGTGGCGFEQQMEAMLKAVTPSTSSITFVMGTVGHGDGANAGFLRTGSELAVVIVTDEEDCSAVDPDIFNPSSARYSGDLNLRCFQFPEAVHPVGRFVDGLLALRPGRPDLVTVSIVAGVPVDMAGASFEAILDDPRMEERIDPDNPTRLVPSCNVPGRGIAFPPRRLVQLAQGFGSNGVVTSICQADFTPVAAEIARHVGRRACSEFE